MNHSFVLSADIGGTHITTALIDEQQRSILPGSQHRGLVNAQAGAEEIIHAWSGIMRQSLQAAPGAHRVGIALPGPFDYDAGISLIKGLHKYEALYGLNVKELLAVALSMDVCHIRMANDAHCFLQGEIYNGAVKGEKDITGFTLGTGFGSAVAVNGIARDAAYFNTPFLESRAEEYFCTRWILRRYQELSGQFNPSVKAIAATAPADKAAVAVFHEFGANLGLFISTLNPVPTHILLGGNIARTYALFAGGLQECLQAKGLTVKFSLSILGEDAPLYGAAGIWQ